MKKVIGLPSVLVLGSLLLVGLLCARWGAPAAGAIYRWDNAELITEKDAEPRVQLSGMDLQYADLAGAQLFSASFASTDLTFAHLMGADLTYADFSEACLTAADFNGALVRGAWLSATTSRGFTAEQLYSTASYKSGDLGPIRLNSNDLRGWSFVGTNLTRAVFQGADLSDANLSGANLKYVQFDGATLAGADFRGADLSDAHLDDATLAHANFSGAVTQGARLSRTTGHGFTAEQLYSTASYQSGDLYRIDLSYNDLSGWDFVDKALRFASFREAILSDANFRGADLSGGHFSGATLTNAAFSGARIARADFVDTTTRGFVAAQLYSTASYQEGDLSWINLTRNDLEGWDFRGKNLTRAHFEEAILSNADFGGADLTRASFSDANLTAAGFREANLTATDFSRATLTNADLAGALVNDADFRETTSRGLTAEQLYSTASYQSGDLTSIQLTWNDFSGWCFAGKNLSAAGFFQANLSHADVSRANLTGADLRRATLAAADFTGALIKSAWFWDTTSRGFTAGQFYATASYQNGDLSGIQLGFGDLSGWNFAGKDLTNASFMDASLIAADFSAANLTRARFSRVDLANADFRGANLTGAGLYNAIFTGADLSFADLRGAMLASAASTEGAILPDGRIEGLTLDAGERLVVRDYNGDSAIPVTVQSVMTLDREAALRMLFEDNLWGSTISFQPGLAVSLGGSLELLFAEDISPGGLIGTTFDLFDWHGAVVSGRFDRVVTEAEAIWDVSNLYTTGEITLVSVVPEPSAPVLLGMGACVVVASAVRFKRRSARIP